MTSNPEQSLKLPSARVYLACLVSAIAFVAFNWMWADHYGFEFGRTAYVVYDLCAAFAFYFVFLSQQRVLWKAVVLSNFLLLSVHATGLAKFEILAEMPRFTDLWAFGALASAIAWPVLLVVVVVYSAALVAVARNWRFSPAGLGVLAAMVIGIGISAFNQTRPVALAESIEHSAPRPAALHYGHILAFVRDGIGYAGRLSRMRAVAGDAPAVSELPPVFPDRPIGDLGLRDVHVVVVESLAFPDDIEGFAFSRSPLSARMAALIGDPERRAFSPVTGGRSPDAEFEVLCGLAALLDWREVVFNALTARQADCLPRKLAGRGWHTLATNPVPGHFFNSEGVYRRIGFIDTAFAGELDTSDTDGAYLSAASTLDQHLERIMRARATGVPVFSYVFPSSTHVPYWRNEEVRPSVTAVEPANVLVAGYANALFYMMQAVETFIDRIHAADPSALIVIVGDHPPYLGPGLADREAATLSALAVPFFVLDGASRALSTGRIAHFEIPALIANLLSAGAPCAGASCLGDPETGERPLPVGGYVFSRAAGAAQYCRDGASQDRDCARLMTLKRAHVRKLIEYVK
ncbi:MAG: sulfatase-like hydrolase/transferase [Rhodospirillales bacterium]